jgi:PAS domain S-box-containing protein
VGSDSDDPSRDGRAAPSAASLGKILDSISEGVLSVDDQWCITSLNRAAEQLLGISRAEALGRPCQDVFRTDNCGERCPLRYTRETGLPIRNHAVQFTNAEGCRVPVSICTNVLRDERGVVIGGVESFRDLSVQESLRKEIRDRYTFQDMVSKSRTVQRIFDVLPTIALTDATVLVEGETGTGKELLARAIHALSQRRNRPLIVVNCGALPDSLLESELFGYEAGAFTDARSNKPGKLSRADRGTLFLDEVGEMSAALQVKLLRVLQDGVFEPLGSVASVEADVRFIAATHHDLSRDVARGAFREDLFYRLNVVPVHLPPLRERREDIPLLIDHFLERFSASLGREITGVSPPVLQLLASYDYPGNVRELQTTLEYACVMCPGGKVEVEHLPPVWRERTGAPKAHGLAEENLEHEAHLIRSALERQGWHRAAAARDLGIHKATLFKKIRKLGIEIPAVDGRARSRRQGP